MERTDTIAAISTAQGEGGIGVIRVSGPLALAVAKRLFLPASAVKTFKPQRLHYGSIKDPGTGRTVDNGYLVYMKTPHSYTGEDIVEFHCHGGMLVLKKALAAILNCGAGGEEGAGRVRIAEPGEFTKRAFLNGKLDLAQAEAIIDLIRSKTEASFLSARSMLEGRFSKKANEIKEILTGLLTRLEAELDFSEDFSEAEGLSKEKFSEGIEKAGDAVKKLISTYDGGRVLKEGIKVIILGRPNAGKSSLLNILLKEERAIVTPVPGTTRDTIEEVVSIKGIPVRLMDTAGLRDTEDVVESIGVDRARKRAAEAGLIIFVADCSQRDFSEDLRMLNSINDRSVNKPGKKIIVVANKTDLVKNGNLEEIGKIFSGYPLVFVSALKEEGIPALEEKIHEEATGYYSGFFEADQGELVTSERHRDALVRALEGMDRLKSTAEQGMPAEFIAADLRWSLNRLGEITGEVTTEDILERIFSEFCIGK